MPATTAGRLVAVRAKTGELVWEHDLVREYDADLPSFGYASSPLAVDDRLIVEAGGADAAFMAFDLESGRVLYTHNQLYGKWFTCAPDKPPRTGRTLRVAIETRKRWALLYSASDISVWDTDHIEEHPFLKRIGPDILNPNLTWREVAERLESKAFSGRALNSVYLDQAFLAGLGNYLRSEILFAAGIHPSRKARELTKGQIGKLARATLEISQRSYALQGVTIPERRYKALKKQGLSYGKARFFVFSRARQPCHICSTQIERSVANSRRIYVCGYCQAYD